MIRRTRDQARREKREAIRVAEAAGDVADSIAVRQALIARVDRGEITLLEAQAELKRIQRGAKRAGKSTRSQVWSRS